MMMLKESPREDVDIGRMLGCPFRFRATCKSKHRDKTAPRAGVVLQFELSPRPATKTVDETVRRREMAEDLAEYLAEHPELRKEIRSRRTRARGAPPPRVGIEGDKPESLGVGRLTKAERVQLKQDEFILGELGIRIGPPRTFEECPPGPCLHFSCRHNLYLEVEERSEGSATVKLNWPGREATELKETCSIRAAMKADSMRSRPRGPHGEIMTYVEVGRLLNLVATRAQQLEKSGLTKLRDNEDAIGGR